MAFIEADRKKQKSLLRAILLAAIPLIILMGLMFALPSDGENAAQLRKDFEVLATLNFIVAAWLVFIFFWVSRAVIPLSKSAISTKTWPPHHEPIALRQKAYSGKYASATGWLLLVIPVLVLFHALSAFYQAYINYQWIARIYDN